MTDRTKQFDEEYEKILDRVIREIVDAERSNFQANRERYRGIPAEVKRIIDNRIAEMPNEN